MMPDYLLKFNEIPPFSEEAEKKIEQLLDSRDPEMRNLGAALFQSSFPYMWWVDTATKADGSFNMEVIRAQLRVYKRRKKLNI